MFTYLKIFTIFRFRIFRIFRIFKIFKIFNIERIHKISIKTGEKLLQNLIKIIIIVFSVSIHASGFQILEDGSPLIGTAMVGQSVVDDATSSYFNPAAMTQLCDSQMQLAAQFMKLRLNFQRNNLNTFPGNDGGNAGGLLPGFGIYDVFSISDDFKFGISLNSPWGGLVDYTDGWVGRFFVLNAELVTIDLNPSFAYRINDFISFGLGAFIEYANLNETINFPIVDDLEGQVNLRLHNYTPGYNAGLFLTPCETTRIGIAYRSHLTHHLKGETSFFRLSITPRTSAILKIPQSVVVSLIQDFSSDFAFLAEAGWVNWKVFKNTIIQIDGITLTIPRNWQDTYRLGFAFNYKFTPDLMWQMGVSYDSSPCKPENRLPDFPVDKQFRAGTGFVYTTCNGVRLGFAYEYINYGSALITHRTRLGTLAGDYRKNIGNVFAINVNFEL